MIKFINWVLSWFGVKIKMSRLEKATRDIEFSERGFSAIVQRAEAAIEKIDSKVGDLESEIKMKTLEIADAAEKKAKATKLAQKAKEWLD